MTLARKLPLIAASALALLGVAGCSAPFKADVARFQQLPPVQGQSFAVVADDPALAGGLEFSQYATLVGNRLAQFGYTTAADPASADLIVRVDYDVDNGREQVQSTGFYNDPFYRHGFGYGGFYGRRYALGFYDPFLFGPGYSDVTSYTVYASMLTMKIDRASDGKRVFEGTAKAQSLSNKLTYLVPNLVDAMFSNFPGQSGETVKVTIAPEPKN